MTKQWGVLALTLGLALCAAGTARADDQTKPDDTTTNDSTIHDQTTLPSDQKTGDVDNDTDVQRQRGVDQTTPADTDSNSMSIKSLKPDQVKQLQQKLTDKGFYQGKIDGHAGPLTLAAFHQFQKDQGVAISDKLDFQSASALGITLDQNEMKPVRGVDESGSGSSGTDVNGTQGQSGSDTGTQGQSGTVNQSGTDSSTSGTTQNQSGTDSSSSGTMQNQSGTDTSATGTTQNQSGTDSSTGTVNQSGTSGSTDIQNQSGTDAQKNKCKDLSSPDAVNCTDGTKNQSGTSGQSSSTDIQNQSGTSTSTTTTDKGSTGYGAGSSSTGNSSYGGVNTDTSTGVQNQSGRDVTSVSDPATIKSAKQALKDKHFYKGKINEKNDDKFQASLRDFQKKNHLAITGTLDQPTLAALGIEAGATDNGTMNNGSGTMDNGTHPTSTPAAPAATGTPSSNPY